MVVGNDVDAGFMREPTVSFKRNTRQLTYAPPLSGRWVSLLSWRVRRYNNKSFSC